MASPAIEPLVWTGFFFLRCSALFNDSLAEGAYLRTIVGETQPSDSGEHSIFGHASGG